MYESAFHTAGERHGICESAFGVYSWTSDAFYDALTFNWWRIKDIRSRARVWRNVTRIASWVFISAFWPLRFTATSAVYPCHWAVKCTLTNSVFIRVPRSLKSDPPSCLPMYVALRFTAINSIIKTEFLDFALSMHRPHTLTSLSQYIALRYVIRIQVISTKGPTYVQWRRILSGCRLFSAAVDPKTAYCEDFPLNTRMYSLMAHFNFTEFSNTLKLCRKQK
jgi:hypothetical protein